MKLSARFDNTPVRRAFARLHRRHPQIVASELNRQRTRSRTLTVRRLGRVLNVKPLKRLRRRMLLPRTGRATRNALVAVGIAAVAVMPARWFTRRARGRNARVSVDLPAGVHLLPGRSTRGEPFALAGRAAVVRRVHPARRRTRPDGQRTHLPVEEVMVDTARAGYAARDETLEQLAREWPETYDKRMQRELRRITG